MELKEILTTRRSVRKYLDRAVEKEKLQRIAEMALSAPSSRNTRSTRLWIVTDKQQLEIISEMRDYGSAFVKNAAAATVMVAVMVAVTSSFAVFVPKVSSPSSSITSASSTKMEASSVTE